MKWALAKLGLIVATVATALCAALPARGDYLTFDIASHETMADYVRFESRSWAEVAEGEGGRLAANTTWTGEHVILNDLYVPSGVTLTVNAGTVVRFREGTRIKVEDGGSIVLNGELGNEVVLEGYEDDTSFKGIVLQSGSAGYSDNCYVIVRGIAFGKFATVSISDTEAFMGGGQALVPVNVSGLRDTAFLFDWVAETNGVQFASGTMNWSRVSDGSKNITVPYPDGLPGCSNFTVRATTLRCCTASKGACVVNLSEFITTQIHTHEAMADYIPFESREWAEGLEGDGGRLSSNVVWSVTHTIVSDVYIPSGVTLTLSADTIVEFCEGTRIKIEDGGKLEIVGAEGHDVILRGADGVTSFGGIVKMSNGTFSDNSYVQAQGWTFSAFAGVSMHDSSTFRSSGLALIPVSVSGSRSTSFSIDWIAETNGVAYKTGTMTWSSVSEGRKNITLEYGSELDGLTNFTVRVAVERACHASPDSCNVKISDFAITDIYSHEAMADYIVFESREWAAGLEGEGGRLERNATWSGTHNIVSDVYIPSGVTLTISADTVVEFCEGTRIKIEDGGTLNIVGAEGHDVIFRGAPGVTDYIGIVKMSNGTYTDNMYVQFTDKPYSAYPYVALHEATTYREAGKLYIPVTLSGTSRSQSFNMDWQTDKGDHGTVTWSSSSDGTKWIQIPVDATPVGGTTNHVITITAARGCNISVGKAALTILEPDYIVKGSVTINESDEASGEFAINGDIKTQPIFLNPVERVQYSGKWQTYDANEATVLRVTIETDNGVTLLKEVSPSETGSFDLDLAKYPVGYYTLKHDILDEYGETLATMQKTFSIADKEDVEMHGGTLMQNETWKAGKVHVVYQTVVVPSIYTIFIEPGAIVKFMTGTGIDISQGGAFFANGIVFTHINDDTVGGDTLSDGYTVAPPMDAYFLSGAFTFGDDTELRGITQNTALAGTISTQKTLSRGSTYRVSGTVTIASGASLTIPPGTVLKMESGAAIVVNSGATLNAIGTRAAPIVITSIKDDSVSGDTNGDGGTTIPQPGDWVKIGVNGGIANFEFVSILYSSKNQTTGAINQNGGVVRFVNSEIAHGMYDAVGVESGNFYMTNSVIRDCLLAFRHWAKDPIVNCIIYDCGRLTQGGGQTFVNCIFSNIAETWEAFGFPKSTYHNCCFWNEGGSVLTVEGVQDAMTVCGSDGNIWSDPFFVDAANGDFRIREGSPCVDAADSAVAPESDFFGQPRITITETGGGLVGQLADIGICEVMPRDVVSDIDLVPQSVRTTTNAVPGQLLFVKWEIANVGGAEVNAAWRDTVSLVSENGREVVLGDKTTSSRVAIGGSVFCSGYFTVPAISEGTWYPKVNVNSYHDIFEGSLSANNALVGERAVSVGLEVFDPSISREGVINAGTPTVLKFAFDEDDANRMVSIDVPAGVKVTWGFGFVPQGASKSGAMVASGDGVMFKVPDGTTEVYVVLESDATTTYNLFTESAQMVITGVSPATLPSSGTTTLTIAGAGFGDDCEIALVSAAGRAVLNAPQKDPSGSLVATVDCAKLAAGLTYNVTVSSGENEATLEGAVAVTKAEGKGHFWYELTLPETGRKGRSAVGVLRYGNSGNANLVAPIIDLVSHAEGQLSRVIPLSWSSALRFIAAGCGDNPGLLTPGEECRIDFLVLSGDNNSFALYCTDGKKLDTEWPTQNEFECDLSEAAYRVGFGDGDASDYDRVYALAKTLYSGTNDNSIGGIVCGTAGEKLSNVQIDLYRIVNNETNKFSSSHTSAGGRFAFNYIEDGAYLIGVAGRITSENLIVVSNGVFAADTRINVGTGRGVSVFPRGLPDDADGVSVTLTSILNPSVVYHPLRKDGDGRYLFDSSISNGYYRVHCLCGNLEGFDGLYIGGDSDVEVEIVMSAPAMVSVRVDGLAEHSLPDAEVIVSLRGNTSGRTYMAFPDAESGEFSIGEMVADTYAVTYSGLTCSYEADKELKFEDGETYSIVFYPLPSERKMTVEYPTTFNNHLLIAAGPEGILTAEALDGSGRVEVSSVCNGRWSFIVVSEDGTQVTSASFELSDDNRVCQIENVNASVQMAASVSTKNRSLVRLQRGLGSWLADKFKALTHWLGEALANLLPISIMDFFETKEWKEGMEISKTARSYLHAHTKIGYPGPCCCGYNDQKYPFDRAALDNFIQQVNSFSTYVQSCSSMKVVASTSKSIADVADNIGEQVICSYTGGLLNKMVQINNIRVRFIALASYVKAAKDLGADYAKLQEELKDLQSSWDAVVFTLEHGGTWMQFEANVSRLTEYITQWSVGKRNYYSHSNKVFAEKLNEFGKVLKDIAIVIEAVKDIYNAGRELDQMRHSVDQFPSRKAQFLQQYAYFQMVADNFGHYHKGTECQPEKWPDPEYEPPFDGPYPYPRVVQSYDPNEMRGKLGLGDPETERFVRPGEELTYTIYFENKSAATAAAQEVYVTNPLSEWLDWSTFEMGEVAFNNQIDLGLSGKNGGTCEATMKGTNFLVRTTLGGGNDGKGAIAAQGVAHWYLRIVDPTTETGWPTDILAGFLPPNDETFRGEGHLTYRIKVREDAPANLVITNAATIVFDYNDPIETDPAWWNTVAPTVGTAKFCTDVVETDEGSNAVVCVSGGNAYAASSVKLYLTYNTAAAADVDLSRGTVRRVEDNAPYQVGLKFPLALSWEAGEIGEKVITIPTKTDKTVEDDEFFTLQLAEPVGMELGESSVCAVTIHDPGYDDLAAKVAAGTATKAELSAWDKLQKAKAPYIRGLADPANAGKVTGSGLCAEGKKVTLKATANKGFVFMGWRQGTAVAEAMAVESGNGFVAKTASLVVDRTAKPAGNSATSTTIMDVTEDATYYADFITVGEDKAAVELTVDGVELRRVEDNAPYQTNVTCGVALEWPVASSALSATTVKVTGLPAGLKFADKPVTAKVGTGKSAVTVTNVPANTIYGAPTAASATDKKTGLPKPSDVKITVTTAGKSSVTYLVKLTVDPLPTWAVGSFEGVVGDGAATMGVTAAGKISGKFALGGTNWTFKADSYSAASETAGTTNLVVSAVAAAGKETMTVELDLSSFECLDLPDSATALAEGMFGDADAALYRLVWADKGDSDAAALAAIYAGAYSFVAAYGDDSGDVAFTLSEKGAIKGTAVLPDGAKTRKATFSANALPEDDDLHVVVAIPADAKKGYPAVFEDRVLVPCSGAPDNGHAYRDPGAIAVAEELNGGSGASGTVTVSPKYGQVAAGKTVTLTAKADKGSVFSRWEIEGVDTTGLDLSAATLKYVATGEGDVTAVAKFVTVEEDWAAVALTVDGVDVRRVEDNAPYQTNVTCGVALEWPVAVDALSQTTVKVAGLPAGLKFTAKDIVDSKTKQVTVPANTIYGAPTSASAIDKNTGLPNPSDVKITVTTAGKSSITYLVKLTVDPLPSNP